MRDYGKVYSSFWTSQDMRGLMEDGRTLALYLMTSPHGNMLGCFRIPDAYASDDLQWGIDRVSKGFAELSQKGFAYRCERSFWVVIHKHVKWNKFDNENVGKAAAKLFDVITPPDDVRALLVKALRQFGKNFPAQKLTEIDGILTGFGDGIETVSKSVAVAVPVAVTGITNPVGLVVASDAATHTAPVGKSKKPDCPHQEIIDLYHKILPQCPQIRDWTAARAAKLRARWNEDEKRQNLTYWKRFFEFIRECDFLVGKAHAKDKRPFVADLEWIVNSSNFTKIREGKYAND